MTWSSLNFKIEHIPGAKNHVDALSRLNTITTTLPDQYSSYTMLDPPYYEIIKNEYLQDPYFIPIYNYLTKHEQLDKEYNQRITF